MNITHFKTIFIKLKITSSYVKELQSKGKAKLLVSEARMNRLLVSKYQFGLHSPSGSHGGGKRR